MKITESEIIEAIRAAQSTFDSPDDAFTVGELSVAMHLSIPIVREYLLALKATGKLEMILVKRESLDGRMRAVPLYRVKVPAKKPKPRAA